MPEAHDKFQFVGMTFERISPHQSTVCHGGVCMGVSPCALFGVWHVHLTSAGLAILTECVEGHASGP